MAEPDVHFFANILYTRRGIGILTYKLINTQIMHIKHWKG